MAMTVTSGGIHLHVQAQGPKDGRVVLFSNSLGTDMRVWDPVLPHLPAGLRILRYDKRGHGLSDCPPSPYRMEDLVTDAAAVVAAFDATDVTLVGLSIGGLIGQGLAARHPEMLRALVLLDTAAKIGTPEIWRDRMNAVERLGLPGISEAILERWFSPNFRADAAKLAPWQNMLTRTPVQGYLGCSAAIAETDFSEKTAALSLPVMAMAGEFDGSTPPEVVRATAGLCGGQFHLVEGAGHIPGVEQPKVVADLITHFLDGT